MITIKEVLHTHSALINQFGGKHGIKNLSALESALLRPFQKYNNKDLYSEVNEKAAALLESMLVTKPFQDGNMPAGYVLMRLLLLDEDLDLYATQVEKYDFIIATAAGELKFDDILSWLKTHVAPKDAKQEGIGKLLIDE
jgi:death-on-curing protein